MQSQGKLGDWLKRHGLDHLPPLWKHLQVDAGWDDAVQAVLRERLSALTSPDSAIAEAAARAGVNRGSLYRWRARDPRFAAKWDAVVTRQAAEAADSIALQANTIDVQPVFYRGKQIGERRKVNTRLLIHIQNRLDADRRRAEDRTERRELMLLRAALAERSPGIRQLATPVAPPSVPEMCSEDLGLAIAA